MTPKPDWTRPYTNCSSWPCFHQGKFSRCSPEDAYNLSHSVKSPDRWNRVQKENRSYGSHLTLSRSYRSHRSTVQTLLRFIRWNVPYTIQK